MTPKELKEAAFYEVVPTYKKNGRTLPNYDLRHYFNADMEEIGYLCTITDYKKPFLFNPPRKWAKSFLTPENAIITKLKNVAPVPLEWAELWEAMTAAPKKWIITTKEMYWNQLEALPPADQSRDAFLVGEAYTHNDKGEAVYNCFKINDGVYRARRLTRKEFRKGV